MRRILRGLSDTLSCKPTGRIGDGERYPTRNRTVSIRDFSLACRGSADRCWSCALGPGLETGRLTDSRCRRSAGREGDRGPPSFFAMEGAGADRKDAGGPCRKRAGSRCERGGRSAIQVFPSGTGGGEPPPGRIKELRQDPQDGPRAVVEAGTGLIPDQGVAASL